MRFLLYLPYRRIVRRCIQAVAVLRLRTLCALLTRLNLSAYLPRKRVIVACFTIVLIGSLLCWNDSREQFTREQLALKHLEEQLEYLKTFYLAREKDVYKLQKRIGTQQEYINNNGSSNNIWPSLPEPSRRNVKPNLSPEVVALLKNSTGMKQRSGLDSINFALIQLPDVYQLLPHLKRDFDSMKPAYHLRSDRRFVDYVIGVPTVKRDKKSYLVATLYHLVNNLEAKEKRSTAIVVFVGETDLDFVLETAKRIENSFPREMYAGLIEVLSPRPSYYPNFTALAPTLGDSRKRFEWRTKQNLDIMYLMAYAQTKGTYYLMLEDDVLAEPNYMTVIRSYVKEFTLVKKDWFIIEFCPDGIIGKLFRSRDLIRFVTYIELFYTNMPIDWLLDSFINDIVCTDAKRAKKCKDVKRSVRIQYKPPLFSHVGFYSSLKGKTYKFHNTEFGELAFPPEPKQQQFTFYRHEDNPPLSQIITNITALVENTLDKAYRGEDFFYGKTRKKGDLIEFWFKQPTLIEQYVFRSGTKDFTTQILKDAAVDVLPIKYVPRNEYVQVGLFDEFGFAEGTISPDFGPLAAIRLRMLADSDDFLILNEIQLRTRKPPPKEKASTTAETSTNYRKKIAKGKRKDRTTNDTEK